MPTDDGKSGKYVIFHLKAQTSCDLLCVCFRFTESKREPFAFLWPLADSNNQRQQHNLIENTDYLNILSSRFYFFFISFARSYLSHLVFLNEKYVQTIIFLCTSAFDGSLRSIIAGTAVWQILSIHYERTHWHRRRRRRRRRRIHNYEQQQPHHIA